MFEKIEGLKGTKRYINIILLLISIYLVNISSASATNYYVSQSGNDANSGIEKLLFWMEPAKQEKGFISMKLIGVFII